MTEFNQKLLDHFMNPRNVGTIENPDGFGRAFNPVNQYLTDIYLRVKDGYIDDIKFKTFGCVVTIAAASALTKGIKGISLSKIFDSESSLKILFELIEKEIGVVPEQNWHCPPTAIQSLLVAFSDYYQKVHDDQRVKQIESMLKDIQSFYEKGLREK